MTATVAIVGRPNVGKSTLFNRLVGQKLALVDDRPGVTRDRREGDARLGPLSFRIIDTAGLEEAEEGSLMRRMRDQTEAAIAEADVILFLMDARAGVLPADQPFVELVRRSGKPVVLVANKAEGGAGTAGAYDAFSLGPRRAGGVLGRARRGHRRALRRAPALSRRKRTRRRRMRAARASRSRSRSSGARTPASRRSSTG